MWQKISKEQGLSHMLVNAALNILTNDDTIIQWVEVPYQHLTNLPLLTVFPELIGYETLISQLIQG